MSLARRIIAAVIACYLLLVFLDRFVLVELLVRRIGVPFLLACLVALACVGAGFLARREHGLAENLAVGYPIFGTICFLIGWLRISTWTMVPLVAIFAIVGGLSVVPAPSPARTAEGGGPPLFAIALVILCAFVAAQAPPNSLDEVAYHLAIPWTWVKEGRAIDLPLLSHSYFPLGVESADLPLFTLLGTNGGIASHFLHLFAVVATVALLFRDDWLIVAAIVTAPVLAVTAGWSLVDWNLLAVALVLVRAAEDDDRTTMSAALAAGLLTKYTFIPVAAIVLITQRRWRGLIPGVVGGSVFFIRNTLLTGNPFAPFLSAMAPHVSHYRSGAYLSDYIFDGHFLDESLGASLLAACGGAIGITSLALMGAGVILFFLAPSARILVPFFALPASRASVSWRPLRVVLGVAIAAQLLLLLYFVDRSGAVALISGHGSDQQFLAMARPSTTTIAAVDGALPANSRLLVIGLNETFWFQHRVRGGGNFDGPRMTRYLGAGTPEALYARLRADGITHVAIFTARPPTADEKKLEERQTPLSPAVQRGVAEMLNRYAASVTRQGEATLFALK